jgi:HD-like signal output (HDOD) protein
LPQICTFFRRLARFEGAQVNIIFQSGQPPSGLGNVRAEVSGLIRYETLDIPALPEHAARLIALAGKPRADLRLLTRLVQADPLVEARVLKVAQYAAYQPSAPISSLGEAISWLGTGEVADMAFTAAVQALLFDRVRGKGRIEECWKASIAAAIWAREIGAVSRRRSAMTYLCGLLHDIGAHAARVVCHETAAKLGVRLTEAEEDAFVNEFQAQFGETLARRWSLQDPVPECMTGWTSWTPSAGHDDQVAVIHLAHHLAEIVIRQGAEFAREALAGNPALEVLNITPDRFTALLDRTTWVVNQVRAY